MSNRSNGAYSIIEMMVALTIFSIAIAAVLLGYAKIQKTLVEDQVRADFATQSSLIEKKLKTDVGAYIPFSGSTTDTTHFENRRVYGILPTPFTDPIAQNRISDSVEIFAFDTTNSTESSFKVSAVDCSAGTSNAVLVLQGDFRPLEAPSEDLLAISFDTTVELYSVKGAITYNQATNKSNVPTNEVMHLCGATTLAGQSVTRAVRIRYQVDQSTGKPIFRRTRAGVQQDISGEVGSMRIYYNFSAEGSNREADCLAKSGLRWFDHPVLTNPALCKWSDLSSIRFEIFFESTTEIGSTVSQNFHTGISDRKARLLSTYQLPASASTND